MTIVEPASELDRCTTVPRTLVHRRAVSEVFITDGKAVGENTFLVAAHLPRGHLYYNDLNVEEHDLMLLIEICRQTGIYISHVFFGVDADARFIFKNARVLVRDHESLGITPGRTQDLTLRVKMTPTRSKGGELHGIGMKLDCLIDERSVGEFEGALAFVGPRAYDKMRALGRRRLSAVETQSDVPDIKPLDPANVGRNLISNVVIGRSESGETYLVNRPTHPSMCDHEVDHVSGMILLEAMRQAAIAETAIDQLNPQLFAMTFLRFVELDGAVQIASSLIEGTHHITISQYGSVAATGEVRFP